MQTTTYRAILKGDRLEWRGEAPPEIDTDRAVPVDVTILGDERFSATRAAHQALRRFIAQHAPAVSVVSYVEVVGYHRLTEQNQRYFEDFFIASPVLSISIDILERATWLRQQRPIGLGDALIAATALVHDLQLLTANTADFKWISDLRLSNPVE